MLRTIRTVCRRLCEMAGSRRGPDFIIIGAQKCGTTTLHTILGEHPDLLPSRIKEIHYFDGFGTQIPETHKRLEYGDRLEYSRLFPLRERLFGGKKTFEATPSYLFHPQSADRMAEFDPNMKLVAILREPITRAYSAWHHYHRRLNHPDPQIAAVSEARSFEEAVNEEFPNLTTATFDTDPRGYVRRGQYAEQLERFHRLFPLNERMLVLFYEEVFGGDSRAQMNRVTQFLALKPMPDLSFPHLNEGRYEREIETGLMRRLIEHYRPHNRRLKEFLGRELPWDECRPVPPGTEGAPC